MFSRSPVVHRRDSVQRRLAFDCHYHDGNTYSTRNGSRSSNSLPLMPGCERDTPTPPGNVPRTKVALRGVDGVGGARLGAYRTYGAPSALYESLRMCAAHAGTVRQ